MLNRPRVPEISVRNLKKVIDEGDAPILVDVRQEGEHQLGNIGGTLLQLDQLPSRISELNDLKEKNFVVYCRSGARSGQAVQFLHAQGFTGATNLKGGMLAWQAEIDPTLSV